MGIENLTLIGMARERWFGQLLWLALGSFLLATSAASQSNALTGSKPPPDSSFRLERPLAPPAGPPRSGAELDRLTRELAAEMRCPVCQGLSIAASRSISALNMRMEVRELLAEGYSPDQVLDYFEQSYGEFVRLTPRPRGINLLVWILPFLALTTGAVLVARQSKRRGAPRDAPSLAEYRERVLQETSVE